MSKTTKRFVTPSITSELTQTGTSSWQRLTASLAAMITNVSEHFKYYVGVIGEVLMKAGTS